MEINLQNLIQEPQSQPANQPLVRTAPVRIIDSQEEPWVRFIGDIHGSYSQYRRLIRNVPHTVQLGDFGFEYEWLSQNQVSATNHRFISGNHDNYDRVFDCPHHLGDFGLHEIPEFGSIFYVRGAWSIDHKHRHSFPSTVFEPSDSPRRPGKLKVLEKNIWPETEQLTMEQCWQAIALYEKHKPNFVISHDCPEIVSPYLIGPDSQMCGYRGPVKTRTNLMLESMRMAHKPKFHLFGHYHRWFDATIEGTRYICIPILGFVDFPKHFLSRLTE